MRRPGSLVACWTRLPVVGWDLLPVGHLQLQSMPQVWLARRRQLQQPHQSPLLQQHYWSRNFSYAVVKCEIKSFQNNYFSVRRRQCGTMLPEIISKLFRKLIAAHEYFPTCSMSLKWFWNTFSCWNNFISVSDVVRCKTKHWSNLKIILKQFYFTCNHGINSLKCSDVGWLHLKVFNAVHYIFNFWHSGTLALKADISTL